MGLKYLPDISNNAIEDVVNGNFTKLDQELSIQSYDRIGIDRGFAILSDISINYGNYFGYSFLDVGCNNGLISNLLSGYGNEVFGIDDFAINSQKRYDDLNFIENYNAKFQQIDIYDYLNQNEKCFDFTLLLSVAHQWEFGYAHSGDFLKNDEKISYIMNTLWKRTNKAMYYECPVNEPGFAPNYGIEFLGRYLKDYPELSVVKIMDTVASNGYIRSLYRISKRVIENNNTEEKNHYETLLDLEKTKNIRGDIVRNGSSGATQYAIISAHDLIVAQKGNERTNAHPLGVQPISYGSEKLWRKIQENLFDNVVKVKEIYSEGFARIEIVDGWPGMHLQSIPSWQKKSNLNNIEKLFIGNWFKVIGQLSNGLAELHKLGIAHGDPYPYNAIIGDKVVKWIDLSNISEGTEEIAKDIIAFFIYSIPWFILKQGEISYQLLKKIEYIFGKNISLDSVMSEVSEIFLDEYKDIKKIEDSDIKFLFEIIEKSLRNMLEKNGLSYLVYYHAYKYHSDFIFWMNQSDVYKKAYQLCSLTEKYSEDENNRLRISKDVLNIEINEMRESYLKKEAEYVSKLSDIQKELEECRKELANATEKMNVRIQELEQKTLVQKDENKRLIKNLTQIKKLLN